MTKNSLNLKPLALAFGLALTACGGVEDPSEVSSDEASVAILNCRITTPNYTRYYSVGSKGNCKWKAVQNCDFNWKIKWQYTKGGQKESGKTYC